ncbi:hypothetical protein [Streptomyces decoyicus]|uniref:hypothetical protein n=1 Tax=Streptomyces decoyicus TaxID=249567 RepID=UPI00386EC85B|nr:hypothetical protein OG532_37265 [Streptomyces decoyicus]
MTETPTATAAEIKISFSGDEARKAACALELQNGEGRSRTTHFWDSPRKRDDGISLPFLDRGVIFRLRLEDGDHGSKRETDMTVKLRPCPRLPPEWRKNRKDEDGAWEFTIEEDRTGPAFTPVVSASLQADRKVEAELVESALRPEPGALGHLLAKPHRHLLEDAAGLKQGDLADLRALGPVYTVKWKQDWGTLPCPVVIEEWITKDLRFLEVSVRTSTADAAEAEKLLEQALRQRDVAPPRSGETKTRAVLTVLARDLAL